MPRGDELAREGASEAQLEADRFKELFDELHDKLDKLDKRGAFVYGTQPNLDRMRRALGMKVPKQKATP